MSKNHVIYQNFCIVFKDDFIGVSVLIFTLVINFYFSKRGRWSE